MCGSHSKAKPLYSRMKYLFQKGAVDDRGTKVWLTGSKGVTQKKHACNWYFLQRSDTSNVGNVDGMANDTIAIFYHCRSTDKTLGISFVQGEDLLQTRDLFLFIHWL